MPRVLPLIATAAIPAPLAIASDDIARIVDGADLASLIAAERAVVVMTGGRVLDYALSGDARAKLTAGEIGTVPHSERATADFDGSFHGTRIALTGNACADVRGGYFLRGGFVISDAATVHVYGSDFSFGHGRWRGFLEDGNPIGLFEERFAGRTDDPLAPFRQLMPGGGCACIPAARARWTDPLLQRTRGDPAARDRSDDRGRGRSGGFVRMSGQASLDIRGGSTGFVGMADDVRVTISGGTGSRSTSAVVRGWKTGAGEPPRRIGHQHDPA